MPRAVLDTNTLISALITPKGTPARIVQAWRDGRFDLVTSPPLLSEFRSAISRPKIRTRYNLSTTDIREILKLLTGATILVGTGTLPPVTLRDPDDLPVLSCAIEGKADYIVTGDNDLLVLERYQKILIVRPSAFLRLIPTA
ncbi:MAG: putative toxin-antitoxin system toxin component, PIN family [Nitrospiraceae bacterium]|nr:putative toxin-antitoxin system toxin component, PIN family [Nitrospiraceae bacterium]